MNEFRDPFPSLSQVIDVGGDKYFMGPQKPIELEFKSRKDYLNSFESDPETERLLRTYLYYGIDWLKPFQFQGDEKDRLIAILEKRAKQIQSSKEFTSSILKNTLLQRSYININQLIAKLKDPNFKGFQVPTRPDILTCTKAKKQIRDIPKDRLYELLLEIAWYLLHPDLVPKDIECDWAKLIQDLDTLRIGDIYTQIQELKAKPEENQGKAYNFFKKMYLDTGAKNTVKNALEEAATIAQGIQSENANKQMTDRVQALLKVLALKKYLSAPNTTDASRMSIIDVPTNSQIKNINSKMLTNPSRPAAQTGGAAKALDESFGIAMKPFFDYFKVTYDPIYTLIESNMNVGANSAQKIFIPQLTTLLGICSSLNPGQTINHGVYRITNVDPEVVSFINSMMTATETHVNKFTEDKDKNTFTKQVFTLPKVRLSTLVDYATNSAYKDPDYLPQIQFFTVNGNMTIVDTAEAFIDPNIPNKTQDAYNALKEFFIPENLYIACTDKYHRAEDIPMNVYEIDYSQVELKDMSFPINKLEDNYFNKNKQLEYYLDKLVNIKNYVVFNDCELALSIFILLKQLMPK